MKTRTHDLTAGSIPQHMLRLAAPLILGNILQQLYNAVDAFILGRCAGGLEFAAVGIAGSVMNLFLFMITGACTGVSVIFAQLFGANDLETFRREHFLSLVFGLLCTLACSAIGFLCLPLLLRVIQTPQELTGYVTAYLTVILISLPAAFVYNLYGALLRAIGRATAALMALAAIHTSPSRRSFPRSRQACLSVSSVSRSRAFTWMMRAPDSRASARSPSSKISTTACMP